MSRSACLTFFFVAALNATAANALETPPPNFKVAFIGDTGKGRGFESVLALIEREGTGLVVHSGDFDYDDDPDTFDGMITEALGDDFPYLVSIGNHDRDAWDGYKEKFQERLGKIAGMDCNGELGVKSACRFKGLFLVLSGVGTMGDGHEEYIRDQMAGADATWKICSWHKNMAAMQVGGKDDETGWGVYEACREAGAMIATAHDHSYARTHLLSSMRNQTVADDDNDYVLKPGQTLAFVSGLGGKGPRGQERGGDYWASIYTSDQGAKNGALFCEYNYRGVPNQARCYFKNVDDEIIDDFMMQSARRHGSCTNSVTTSLRSTP